MILSAKDKRIIELWAKGWSSHQISHELGITRNAVMGRIFRLRKAGACIANRPTRPPKKERPEKKIRQIKEILVHPDQNEQAQIDNLLEKVFVQKGNFVGFFGLKPNACRFIMNHDLPTNYLYCNERTDGTSYCKDHHKIVYVPSKPALKGEKKEARPQINF